MAMANVQIRVDESLKTQAQAVATNMGIDLASAIRMFLTQMVKENGLPFQPSGDPFYSTKNQTALEKSIRQLNAGQTVTKNIEELEIMAR